MKTFLQFITEATVIPMKGFINIDGRRSVMKKYNKANLRPYHTEMVVNDPKSFGTTKEKLLKRMARFTPYIKPEEHYEELSSGGNDFDLAVMSHTRSEGWWEVYIEGDGNVGVNNNAATGAKDVHRMAKILEREYRISKNFPNNSHPPRIYIAGGKGAGSVTINELWIWQRYLITGDIKKAEDPLLKVGGSTGGGSKLARFR